MKLKKLFQLFVMCILCLKSLSSSAQYRTIHYQKSNRDIPNPERGFYLAAGEAPGELKAESLKALRTVYSPKSANASYSTWVSLVYRGYLLTEFRNAPLSDGFLSKLQKDLDAIRTAGLKVILRFSYIDKVQSGDCADGAICPPYGDAPKHIVLQHILQLKPVFHQNADVIAVVQQGFIGIWGENHYTDYFGDPSRNGLGYIPDSSWADRNQMLKALLDAVPKSRMVQVRTPQLQQRFFYGAQASIETEPSLASQAFDSSDNSRVALHNDCFLASPDDYETFSDYGNSSGRSRGEHVNRALRKYFEEESKYVAVGGETCDDAYSPQNDCPPNGHAVEEMAAMHYSFLNVSYNNLVNNDWEEQGCMTDIKQRLGYRLVLQNAEFPKWQKKSKTFQFKINILNEGFASPYNPRTAYLVLRSVTSGNIHEIPLQTVVQKWFSGEHNISETVSLPPGIKKGKYELLLNLPDSYPSLKNNAVYSIRMANEGVWEDKTGYNKLNYIVNVY